MLTPEQAKSELRKLEDSQWLEARIAAEARLPESMRGTTRALLQPARFPPLEEPETAEAGAERRVRDFFAGLDAAGRGQLFECLFPGLGLAVERGWQLLDRLPYQSDWGRKPFRASNRPDILLERRVEWVTKILSVTGRYRQDIQWFAAWAPHISDYGAADSLGLLLAAAIDAGGAEGDAVFEILCASAKGEHAIGAMGRHVTRALLSASRPDGWKFVEQLMLAAQRQEGLRQTILECVDEAHPEAFRRMLRLILEHNLGRFSATVRAFDTWLGYLWESDSAGAGTVNKVIERMLVYLEDEPARTIAIQGKDAEQTYLALWAIAFDDAPAAIEPAGRLLRHPKAEFRFAGAHLLGQLQIPEARALHFTALEDDDLHMPFCALQPLQYGELDASVAESNLFERLEPLLSKFPNKQTRLKPLIWPWTDYTVDRTTISGVFVRVLGRRPATRLIPRLGDLTPYARSEALRALARPGKIESAARDAFLAWLGDGARPVRDAALEGLKKSSVSATEAPVLEALLTRNAADLRRGVLGLLLGQEDDAALASADRLLAARSGSQRLAGLELLGLLAGANRSLAGCRERVSSYRQSHPTLAGAERQQIQNIETTRGEALTLDNALGLTRHEERTWPGKPVVLPVKLHSDAAIRLVGALDKLVDEHRETMVTTQYWDERTEQKMLGEAGHGFPEPKAELSLEQDRARLPLIELWESWWAARGEELRDADGMEALRAVVWYSVSFHYSDALPGLRKRCPDVVKQLMGDYSKPRIQHGVLLALLRWFLRLHPPAGAADFVLDAAQTSFALVPDSEMRIVPKPGDYSDPDTWRDSGTAFQAWADLAWFIQGYLGKGWTDQHSIRLFRLMRWVDQPFGREKTMGPSGHELMRQRPDFGIVAAAHRAGGATDADVYEQLLGFRGKGAYCREYFGDLSQFTARKEDKLLKEHPELRAIVDRCRERVLEVELVRGETPTPASSAALEIRSVFGIDTLMAILRAHGEGQFARGYKSEEDRGAVFSHLVRCCFPKPDETIEQFGKQAKASKISEQRLVELGVYAPQWVEHAGQALGWKSYADAVWWIHAHTKGDDWAVEQEIRELWQADLNRRTALGPEDLVDGAVDVAWFHRVHAALGDKRWALLHASAKFASSGTGHARARLFADAMLGNVTKKELVQRITQKRHQDAVRALGLLPLAAGKAKDMDVLDRYKVIQEFRRGSREFGSQRQASEKRTAQIALQNLARTAGFADPIRLEWAMEAKAVEDLADGPIEVVVEGVKLTLGTNAWGEVELNVSREGRTLSDIPAKLKKHPKVAALRERKVELKRQASRIRPSLEQFMVRGEEFTGAELRQLIQHPLLAPLLQHLVLIGEGIAGYPVHGGKALEDARGGMEAVKPGEKLRIAHPRDLLPASHWHRWQKDCFARERIQPFKQVFREYYPLTEAERREGTKTLRYAGHQVQPRQALALLGQRGWVNHPEEGVRKVFHEADIVAWLSFQEHFHTPAEVEGLTLDGVTFTKRSQGPTKGPLKLASLPPRLFSEAMRDLDLVVSVAHRGGVDPEASASTVEMRATLVEETCRLLKLRNVRVKDRHVFIQGEMAEYTVHLGSAVTRKMPGEALFIVAVHSQHRGRLFLPFADDDPVSAEVMSKVLLLARDRQIQDPAILEQIRGS